jgi:hypothetical protein
MYAKHLESSSSLVASSHEILTPDIPSGASAGILRVSNQIHSSFYKRESTPTIESQPKNAKSPGCQLFIDGKETGLTRYGTSRTAIGCFFRDGGCGITYRNGNDVYHHDTSSMDTFYLEEDDERFQGKAVHAECVLELS